MPDLAIDSGFFAQYRELEKPVQEAVDAALGKFEETFFAGGHLETPHESRDPRWRTLRITRFYRGVVLAPAEGDTYLLVTVLPHDDAYLYCKRKRSSVNTAIGVLEIRDEENLEDLGTALQSGAQDASEPLLFDHVSDKHLKQLGVDADIISVVRLLPSEGHLDVFAPLLPTAQYNALVAMASGMTVEEAWAEISKDLAEPVSGVINTADTDAAIRRSPDRMVVVEGPEELAEMLRRPFDVWRVFLHPRQRRTAFKDGYGGPAMVTGGAGTGKTVTALHRCAHLAARYAVSGDGERPPVLLTTFTRNLDAALSAQADLLMSDRAVRSNVEVRTVDSVANAVVRAEHGALSIQSGRQLAALWEPHAAGSGFSAEFLLAEWEDVVLAQDLRTEQQYLDARRRGRGERLGADQRRTVWKALLAATRAMSEAGVRSYTQVCAEAADIVERSGDRPYSHVVVDESQDLHPAKWRLVRALVPRGADDLFIAGDPHQRIYDHRVSLAAVGINVRGRSRRLTVSYRSTQEILSWAVGVLGSSPVDGLDGVADRLEGYASPLHGRRPTVTSFNDRDQELAALAATVQGWLDEGVEPSAIGVAARTNALVKQAAAALDEAGVASTGLHQAAPGVRVGTMHGMKGLEFQCVAVIGADADTLPEPKALTPADTDPVAHAHDLKRERNLLFVSATRARDHLAVSHTGAPSPFLPR